MAIFGQMHVVGLTLNCLQVRVVKHFQRMESCGCYLAVHVHFTWHFMLLSLVYEKENNPKCSSKNGLLKHFLPRLELVGRLVGLCCLTNSLVVQYRIHYHCQLKKPYHDGSRPCLLLRSLLRPYNNDESNDQLVLQVGIPPIYKFFWTS